MTTSAREVAIISGGGFGIGRATAIGLCEDDWQVVVVDRDADKVRETAELAGSAAAFIVGDVTDPDTSEAAVKLATELGPLTGLVNCAGVRIPGRITDLTAEQWRASFSVNVDGIFHFCKAAIPYMQAAGGGSIVNISSTSAYGRKKLVGYSTSKAAVNMLTTCLAADHLDDHIRANVVVPPFTLTGMTQDYPAEKLQAILDGSPNGKAAAPEDVAQIIRFLMSPEGGTFTGGTFGAIPTPSF